MQFHPGALIVLVLFFAVLLFSLRSGSSATHAAQAIVTVLILIGLGGLAFRGPGRS
jgi:hypothetical protein